MNIKTLEWDPVLLKFFRIKPSVLPKIVSSSQVYGEVEHGSLKGVQIGGLIGDQQGALVGNKCFHQGEAKCTFGTGAFLLFNTGNDVVKSDNGLLATVGPSSHDAQHISIPDRLVTRRDQAQTRCMPWRGAVRCTVSFRVFSAQHSSVGVAGSAIKW